MVVQFESLHPRTLHKRVPSNWLVFRAMNFPGLRTHPHYGFQLIPSIIAVYMASKPLYEVTWLAERKLG